MFELGAFVVKGRRGKNIRKAVWSVNYTERTIAFLIG